MTVAIADVRAWDTTAFGQVADARIQAAIDMAEEQHDAAVWGTRLDHGVLLLACHLLAGMSDGRPLRMNAKTEETTYGVEWQRMRRVVGAAYRVIP